MVRQEARVQWQAKGHVVACYNHFKQINDK
jgi:hypothetical protein